MTADEAITSAFRAASGELRREPLTIESYETYLIAAGDHLDKSAQGLSQIAISREKSTRTRMETLEQLAFLEVYKSAIGALLALAAFPYLSRIPKFGEQLSG